MKRGAIPASSSAQPQPPRRGAGHLLGALAVALVAFAVAGLAWRASRSAPSSPSAPAGTPPAAAARADFVGAQACGECHADELRAWTGSHHQLAMQPANEASVLGNFDGATFEHGGLTSTFFRRDGKFLVRTAGADGAPADFEIADTFGVFPLQQYLVAFPGGRLQALGIAWDSRPASAGGQRWFQLDPDEPVAPGDALHWTGRYQTWNLMCAECHSTDLRKGYDAATDSYATTFSELNVACEACHGPGRRHAEWARTAPHPSPQGGDDGLDVHLASDWAGAWTFAAPDAKFPQRKEPLDPAVDDVCATCHAKRSRLIEGEAPGTPLEDSHRLALLVAPDYHADGQQRGEVYTWGSFLQSRMHARGVSCVDCHDPHTLATRQPGNALCLRCHPSERFDTREHHFHDPAGAGGRCVACHMPAQTYMVVHDRLDHSLRVPRPDLSVSLGTPNACTSCHADEPASWAAAAMDGWYGREWRGRPQWATELHDGATGAPGSLATLLALARDATTSTAPGMPPIVRATAAALAQPLMTAGALPAATSLLGDADPMVRAEALGLFEPFDASVRAAAAAPLLADPVRGVRLEAARLLVDVPDAQLPADRIVARTSALAELSDELRLNADWPAGNVNRGDLARRQGRLDEAVAAYERALALDPRFVGASVNLADALRELGRDADGEQVLRRGLALSPQSAELHESLGLLLVRRKDTPAALAELARATELAPDDAHAAFVDAVALHSAGKVDEALDVLRAADARNAPDVDVLGTLVSILRERGEPGDAAAALDYARRLAALDPGNAEFEELVKSLQRP